MPAEIEFFDYTIEEDEPVDNLIIEQGEIEASDFFGDDIGLLASCDTTDESSTIMLIGQLIEERIFAKVFEDDEDTEGEEVELVKGQATIVRPQEIVVCLMDRGVSMREAVVYWTDDDEPEDEYVPDDSGRLLKV